MNKPSTPSNEELTQRMEVAPETQARLVKLVRDMCLFGSMSYAPELSALFDEAHALKADLPKPVDPIDPDEQVAIAIVQGHYPEAKDSYRGRRFDIALEAIKVGRTLAAGGTAHE